METLESRVRRGLNTLATHWSLTAPHALVHAARKTPGPPQGLAVGLGIYNVKRPENERTNSTKGQKRRRRRRRKIKIK